MALTKCPECGKDVSTRAAACPHCGCPVGDQGPTPAPVGASRQGTSPETVSQELVAPSHYGGLLFSQDFIYIQLSQTLQKPVHEILSSLEMKIEVGACANDSFVLDFLAAANRFAEQCCSSYAELRRHSSCLPEVRAMPTVNLANQIRAEVFPKCDAIL
ncbi:MAG: hypothetical protein NT154_06415 [Verrucomicrobia bacterium]|nr:hypothetical protein [Verrucomicrobiota bacterium]